MNERGPVAHRDASQRRISAELSVREARLRPAHAGEYPELPPGVWLTAAEISARVLFVRFARQGPDALGTRPLDDEHFEFRGGWTRETPEQLRTRANDSDFRGPVRTR
jgi:hypothetical protein